MTQEAAEFTDDASAGTIPDVTPELAEIERWFVARGVPHFIERKIDGSILDAWTRALPLLLAAYLLLGLNALDLADWSVIQNLGAAALTIVVLITAWAISNRVRSMPTFARPTDIDPPDRCGQRCAPRAVWVRTRRR